MKEADSAEGICGSRIRLFLKLRCFTFNSLQTRRAIGLNGLPLRMASLVIGLQAMPSYTIETRARIRRQHPG